MKIKAYCDNCQKWFKARFQPIQVEVSPNAVYTTYLFSIFCHKCGSEIKCEWRLTKIKNEKQGAKDD